MIQRLGSCALYLFMAAFVAIVLIVAAWALITWSFS